MKKTALMKFMLLAMVAMGATAMSGCNTVQGFGKDMSKLGDKIENKAEEKKSY
jgi:entericidin A